MTMINSAYLDWLKQAADQYGLRIHAYVLMINHVYLLAPSMEESSIGKPLQSLYRVKPGACCHGGGIW